MYRLPIMVAARFAIYAGVRSVTETTLTDEFGMEDDAVALPGQIAGVTAALTVGNYTDSIVNTVANKIQRRREQAVAE